MMRVSGPSLILLGLAFSHMVALVHERVKERKMKKLLSTTRGEKKPTTTTQKLEITFCILLLALVAEICSRTKLRPVAWLISFPVGVITLIYFTLKMVDHSKLE
jgi:xanthine/uracil permease